MTFQTKAWPFHSTFSPCLWSVVQSRTFLNYIAQFWYCTIPEFLFTSSWFFLHCPGLSYHSPYLLIEYRTSFLTLSWHFLQYDDLSYIPSLSNIAFLTILTLSWVVHLALYMNVETVTVSSSPGPVQFQTPRKLVANPWQSFSPALSSCQPSQSPASLANPLPA